MTKIRANALTELEVRRALQQIDGVLNTTLLNHHTRHENGGADEINVAGLSGELVDPQPPKTHASSHQNGGADEVATATAAANAVPKADASGKLDTWISDGSTTAKGKVELATNGEASAGVVVQGNDTRLARALVKYDYSLLIAFFMGVA